MNGFKNNIWKMYLFKFLISLHFFGAVMVPFFTDWGNISFTQILILQSWFAFWVFALEIPTGTVADFFGRKYSLALGAVANVIGAIVYASSPNFYVFMLGEFLWAVAASLYSGADEALLYDSLKKTGQAKDSKKIFGRIESIEMLAILIASPLGSLIAAFFGLQFPMLFMSVPLALAFFVGMLLKEPKAAGKIEENKNEKSVFLSVYVSNLLNKHQQKKKETINIESKRYLNILKEGVGFFWKNKILKILAADMIAISSIAYFMIWLYQPMLKQAGVSIMWFGLVHAGLVLTEILLMNNFERLENIFGSKKRLIFFSAFITGIAFIVGGLTNFLPIVLLAIWIGGGFGLSRRPLFASYMNKYIPSEKRATVLSSISMLRKFALVIINPVVGMMIDWSMGYTMIILGAAAVAFSLISKVEERHLKD